MLLGYGVDLAVAEIGKRLVREGHTVTIYTTDFDDTYLDYSFEIKKFNIAGAQFNRILPIYELNTQLALRKIRDELEGFDVIVSATFPFYGMWIATKKPTVFFDFGNVPTKGFTWKGKLNWLYLHLIETYLHSLRASRIVTISRFLSRRFLPETRKKLEVIYLGGDHYYSLLGEIQRDVEIEIRRKARRQWKIEDDAVVIACCTRLHRKHAPYKGLTNLLKLYLKLKERYRIILVLAGIGSSEDVNWLKDEGAIPLVKLPPREMPKFYLSADIYVTMTEWEGLNLPILEASWFGVPSVAYRVAAHPEIPASILVDTPQEFIEALSNLIENPTFRRDLGEKSREQAGKFNWDATAHQFSMLLKSLSE